MTDAVAWQSYGSKHTFLQLFGYCVVYSVNCRQHLVLAYLTIYLLTPSLRHASRQISLSRQVSNLPCVAVRYLLSNSIALLCNLTYLHLSMCAGLMLHIPCTLQWAGRCPPPKVVSFLLGSSPHVIHNASVEFYMTATGQSARSG